MKEKITHLLRKRFSAPSLIEIRYSSRTLGPKRKVILLAACLLFFISGVGFLYRINQFFSVEMPVQDGVLREGIMGTPYFVNPLLAISDVDRDVVNLIYSGLMRFDGQGNLLPDLAERYEIEEDGLSYTFHIRPEAKWHDGATIDADDVIFTIQRIKMQAVKSPKRANWEGVETEKIDDKTVKFLLKRPYAPFLENTALGILPKHIWQGIPPEQMTFSELNIKPIGSGPYKIESVERNSSGIITSYTLKAFNDFSLGEPNIKKIILKFYTSEDNLLFAYKEKRIDSLSILSSKNTDSLRVAGAKLEKLALPRVFGVFFNQNVAPVFANAEVREALNLAVDKERIVNEVLAGYGTIIDTPIPPAAFGSSSSTVVVFDPDKAKTILEQNKWKYNEEDQVLEKKSGKKIEQLSFSLATSNTEDLVKSANLLKQMWEALGVKVDVKIFEIGDLEQNVIRPRKYDALLFGEVVGHDPDPFAFWHSSQRNDPGLNIALYANVKVDKILEEARALTDSEQRRGKYREFQEQIKKDAPAIFLYAPYYLYLVPDWLKGVNIQSIAYPAERFSQIHEWYKTTRHVWKIFAK